MGIMPTGASASLEEQENPGDIIPRNEGSSGVFKVHFATVAGTSHHGLAFDDYPAELTGFEDAWG